MFLQHRDTDKLQVLLSRFVDREILTAEIVFKTSEYLFFNGVRIPSMKDKTLMRTLVYLKDLMEVNELMTIDDILYYYQRRRSSLRLYMHRTIESPEIDLHEPAPAQVTILFGWALSKLPKALPPSANCISVCYCSACAVQMTPYMQYNQVLSHCSADDAQTGDAKRILQNKQENEAVY